MDLEALVTLIVEEVRRALGRQAAPPKRLLVVLTGAPADPGRIATALSDLAASGRFAATLLLSRTAARRVDRRSLEQALGAGEILSEGDSPAPPTLAFGADLVLVPWLSLNSAAKLATGVCDTVATSVLMLALLRGIPVLACAEELDPEGPCLGSWARPAAALASLLRSHLATLRQFGIELIGSDDLTSAALAAANRDKPESLTLASAAPTAALPGGQAGRGPGRPVITRADVEAALAAGNLGLLPPDGVWTPLAREAARAAGRG